MKKAFRIIIPILMVLVVLASIGWYFLIYDSSFTQELLLSQARRLEAEGNHSSAVWLYNLAYRHADEDDSVAIELAQQFIADGNYTKAEFTLSNAIADNASVELYLALCSVYVEQDKLLDAVRMLDTVGDPAIKAELDAQRPAAPVPEAEPGFYNQYIPLRFIAEDGALYVTTDGTFPTTEKAPYTEEYTLPAGETTVYALTVAKNGLVSPVTVCTYTVVGVIEAVTFQDAAIEAAIRQTLNFGEETTIYTNDLWNITALTMPAEAKSYADLSYLPQLRELKIENPKSDDFSFLASLKNLESLDITDVALSDTSLENISQSVNLAHLSLPNCGLSSIAPLAKLQNLKTLNLNGNSIRDLKPLSNMLVLEELSLQYNAVNDISPISSLPVLKKLDLSYNSLTSIATVGSAVNLEYLDVTHNALTDLTAVGNLKALTYFAAADNQLTNVVPLSNCKELTTIDISGNKVADISSFGVLTKLMYFDFSYNMVTALPVWPMDCALVKIDGSYNLLKSVDELKDLYNLNRVNMDYNAEIASIDALESCPTLVQVDVYGTMVTDVTALTARSIIVNFDPTTAFLTEPTEIEE